MKFTFKEHDFIFLNVDLHMCYCILYTIATLLKFYNLSI